MIFAWVEHDAWIGFGTRAREQGRPLSATENQDFLQYNNIK
jgi:hypothetical protein